MDEIQKKLDLSVKKNSESDKIVCQISNAYTNATKFKYADIINKYANTAAQRNKH